MRINKSKLALSVAAISMAMSAAQVANAGFVEVNVGTKVSTFSTDISGTGSETQPFFAPDVRWFPGEDIAAGSTVRFNLGGKDGNPAQFATNAININNFVLYTSTGFNNVFDAAFVLTGSGPGLSAGVADTLEAEFGNLDNTTVTEYLAAVNAAIAASDSGTTLNVSGNSATMEVAAAAQLTGESTADAGTAAAAIVAALITDTTATPAVTVTSTGGNPIAAGSYTNGDSANWKNADGSDFGRIFQSTSAGGVGSFDVTVVVNPALSGDTTVTTGADYIELSLNSGRYEDDNGDPRGFGTANIDLAVDITNLKAQGFDGTTVAGYSNSGSINVEVSVGQGGNSVDITNGNNKTLLATSASPITITGYTGNLGINVADNSTTAPTTINTADAEKLFSVPSTAGSPAWYEDELDNPGVNYNHLGSFIVNVADLPTSQAKTFAPFGGGNDTNTYTQISDPNGDQYAISNNDTVGVTISADSESGFAAFGGTNGLFLRAGGQCSGTFSGSTDDALTVNTATGVATNSDVSLVSGTAYTLCAIADGSTAIETITATVSASLNNSEPTYQDPVLPEVTLGSWARNGCSVTFFNVPKAAQGTANAYTAALRFTNTTASSTAGTVRATAWAEDGSLIGTRGALLTDKDGKTGLVGHATGIYTATELQNALGTDWTGRARVVLSGGFNTCEGLNMIASPNGTATNVTATTNANTNTHNPSTKTQGFNGNNTN